MHLRDAIRDVEHAVHSLGRHVRGHSPGQGGNPGDWYFNRGKSDALRGRARLFRRRKGELVPVADDHLADEWEDWKREDYDMGYDAGLVEEQGGSPRRNLWSKKVHTHWHPPAGLFSKSAGRIAMALYTLAGHDEALAMRRLNFYVNRAGKNLSATARKKLEVAKRVLERTAKVGRQK